MVTECRFIILFLITLIGCKNAETVLSQKNANRLINESSPYLLQHAYNPVDWHPWDVEVLEKAKKENKLLIISIGYAACHWCHVMEHESFEDDSVAQIMNEYFIPIKVDREERPDVDDIYMSAAQLVSGRGGWPLNAFALPDGRPIWAGTYFPKDQWMKILFQFKDLKENDYERLVNSAEQLVSGINSLDNLEIGESREYLDDEIEALGSTFITQIDQIDGGRRGAPKFPMPNNYEYLLKYSLLYDSPSGLEAFYTTINKMANGGIYDQVGGGFARYSVDAKWLVPHFEKMLYDNAQLISLYSDAYRLTQNQKYRRVIEESLEFIEREMTDQRGRFYSSLDADSEGEEGKFYVWSWAELESLFTDKFQFNVVRDYYNIEEEGNWEHGKNILHIIDGLDIIASRNDVTIDQAQEYIQKAKNTLLAERSKRVRPGLDDKILTSWNALMIKGYVDAFKGLRKEDYLDKARKASQALIDDQMHEDYRLLRNHKDGKSSINAFLDDYALTIQAFLALYEVTFEEDWIEKARGLADYTLEHFYDEERKMFYYASDLDPPLVARKLELNDNVIPASNSIMARNLLRLGELFYETEYIELSEQMLSNIWSNISTARQPSFYSNWLQLQLDVANPPFEIAICGENAQNIAQEMMSDYRPNVFYMGSNVDSELPLLKYKYVEEKDLIYVCQNKTCKMPVSEISKAEELLSY